MTRPSLITPLLESEYFSLEANPEGILCCATFPGLWLAKDALLSGNLATVLTVLQQGLATVEHQNFVAQLSKPKR